VGMILAAVARTAGLIDEAVFASVVLMVMVTTLLTPLFLRLLYPRTAPEEPSAAIQEEADQHQEPRPLTERE